MYQTVEDHFYLVPTAETPLTNFFRDEILDEAVLPIYRCATRPASARGRQLRQGRARPHRLHQFDKVELLKWVHPTKS